MQHPCWRIIEAVSIVNEEHSKETRQQISNEWASNFTEERKISAQRKIKITHYTHVKVEKYTTKRGESLQPANQSAAEDDDLQYLETSGRYFLARPRRIVGLKRSKNKKKTA